MYIFYVTQAADTDTMVQSADEVGLEVWRYRADTYRMRRPFLEPHRCVLCLTPASQPASSAISSPARCLLLKPDHVDCKRCWTNVDVTYSYVAGIGY